VNKPVVPADDTGAVYLSKRRLFLADHGRRTEKLGKSISRVPTNIIWHHRGSLKPRYHNRCNANKMPHIEWRQARSYDNSRPTRPTAPRFSTQ
jgi:hypothetical protein